MVFSLSSLELSGEIRRTVLFIIIQRGAPFVINKKNYDNNNYPAQCSICNKSKKMIIIIIIHHGALFVINQNLKPCWQELLFCQIIIMRTCKGPPGKINKIRRECFEWTIYSFHVLTWRHILQQVKHIVVFVSPASAWMDKVFLLSLSLVGPLCSLILLRCTANTFKQIHKYEYKFTNTNAQIRNHKYTHTKNDFFPSGDLLGALQWALSSIFNSFFF